MKTRDLAVVIQVHGMDCVPKGRELWANKGQRGKSKCGLYYTETSLSFKSFPRLSYSPDHNTLKTLNKSPLLLIADISVPYMTHCSIIGKQAC